MNREHHDNLLMHGQAPDRTQVCPKRRGRELGHQARIPRGFTLVITGVLGRFQGHSAQKNHLAQGFSTLALDFTILGQIIPCGGCHPVHCRRFRSIPGHYPLDARNMPHCQSYTPKCLWDQNYPQLRTNECDGSYILHRFTQFHPPDTSEPITQVGRSQKREAVSETVRTCS